jgi:hypothetical protein
LLIQGVFNQNDRQIVVALTQRLAQSFGGVALLATRMEFQSWAFDKQACLSKAHCEYYGSDRRDSAPKTSSPAAIDAQPGALRIRW